MSSKQTQDGSKEAEDSPEKSPGGLKMAPRRLKLETRWIQEASRGLHVGPKWNQKGTKCMSHGDPNRKYGIVESVEILRVLFKISDQEGPISGHVASLES